MGGMRSLTCAECDEPFEHPIGPGLYPSRCPKHRDTGRQRSERAREARRSSQRREAARERQLRRAADAARERALRRFDGLIADDQQMVLLDEVLEAARLAAERGPADRRDVRKAVVRLAHAAGPSGTRDALLRLAGVCIRMAAGIPQRSVEPNYNEVREVVG